MAATSELDAVRDADLVPFCVKSGDTAAMQRIAVAMPAQLSSTAQDPARGKPTEIDRLNGLIARRGAELGVPTPVNQALHALVKLAEAAQAQRRARHAMARQAVPAAFAQALRELAHRDFKRPLESPTRTCFGGLIRRASAVTQIDDAGQLTVTATVPGQEPPRSMTARSRCSAARHARRLRVAVDVATSSIHESSPTACLQGSIPGPAWTPDTTY
jgi:hypothetical protein